MKKISIAIMVLVVALASCKKTPEVNLKYVDVERDLITVGTTTATVQCDYQYIATLKKAYLCYGEGENEDNFCSAEMRVVQNTLYVDLDGLTANTTYNYYYEFHNGFNSMRTALKTFKTEGGFGPAIILPTVVTGEVTEITTSSAKGSGEVTNDGGAEVTERGICWSTNENHTLSDNHVAAGIGTGDFTALMSGLEANTTYHVRAYATNEVGTAYGLDREFVTVGGGGSGVPEGAINGLFTINENGDQVFFSQGNLQYQASTNTWRFAENQLSFVGGVDMWTGDEWGNVYENGMKCDNTLASSSYDGWIALFSWGTSGYHDNNDPYNIHFEPWETTDFTVSPEYNFVGYGPSLNMPSPDLTESSENYDWGIYNAISNGGNETNLWRTLSMNEWDYVLNSRNTTSGVRYVKATVAGYEGIVLLPDDWDNSYYNLNNTNSGTSSFGSNEISLTTWESGFEQAGAVFLLEAGVRGYYQNSVVYQRSETEDSAAPLTYWTTTHYGSSTARCLYVCDNSFDIGVCLRTDGRSVRLVQDAH